MARAFPLEKLRNFGIVAHVDAGKTTTSERILFYTGMSHKIGEVHDGATVTDWMDQERERGITITAAAISCNWAKTLETDRNNTDKQFTFNIIDTPGHIDFTAEVKRSMRVLDGAVVVFDGAAGVEPQTETNWGYADEANVPRICFVNKMDKTGADFDASVKSIEERLSKKACRIQIPMGAENDIRGVVDLVSMKAYSFAGEMGMEVTEAEIPEEFQAEAEARRAELIERVVEHDDALMEAFLEGNEPSNEDLKKTLRKAVLANEIFPVMTGTALQNIGVQLVLDAVVDYLPSPLDLPDTEGTDPKDEEVVVTRKPSDDEPMSALVFKLQDDKFVGQLAFFRVYSGKVTSGTYILNSSTGNKERVGRIVRLMADKREEVDEVYSGEIAAAVGIKEVKTSHTLCDLDKPILLETITFPAPVVAVRVEPKTKQDQEKMGVALKRLSDEDPTFVVSTDDETLETIIAGMGELHLDILVDRMKREFGVEADIGKPQVAYRETIQREAEAEYKYVKQSGGRGQYGHVKIRIKPLEALELGADGEEKKLAKNVTREDHFEFINTIKGGVIPQEFIPAVMKGCKEAMGRGFVAGYKMEDVSVELYDGSFHDVDSSEIAFKLAGINAFKEAAKRANAVILEPVMKVEVRTPDEYVGDVNGGISSKRGQVEASEEIGGKTIVNAKVPLSEMFGYTNTLRSMTQGRASMTMEFDHYAVVPPNVAADIKKARGISDEE
ncbi:MAG: elongation factor G [Candidatus Paceibacteria bacterium]|jgi:elongation factor G